MLEKKKGPKEASQAPIPGTRDRTIQDDSNQEDKKEQKLEQKSVNLKEKKALEKNQWTPKLVLWKGL